MNVLMVVLVHWECVVRWVLVPLCVVAIVRQVALGEGAEAAPFVQALLGLLFCWWAAGREEEDEEDEAATTEKKTKNRTKAHQPQRKKAARKKKRTRMDTLKDGDPPPRAPPTPPLQPLPEWVLVSGAGPGQLYARLLGHALSPAQLLRDDYPRPSGPVARSSLPAHDTERRCVRCRSKFEVVKGEYCSGTECLHHYPVKRCPVTGRYECCGGDALSPGCTRSPYHVTGQHCLEGVAFHRIRPKRQVRGGHREGVYALDCEMSYTTAGLEVVRVALVALDGLTVYESHVLPDHPVLDYNTRYSGVTRDHLRTCTTTLADVQAYLLRTLNADSILVGHALANDLKALRIVHERVVDTSVMYPRERGKWSLRALAREHLGRDIRAHDCAEDARAALALALLKIRRPDDENGNAFLLNATPPATPIRIGNAPAEKKSEQKRYSYAEVLSNQTSWPDYSMVHYEYGPSLMDSKHAQVHYEYDTSLKHAQVHYFAGQSSLDFVPGEHLHPYYLADAFLCRAAGYHSLPPLIGHLRC